MNYQLDVRGVFCPLPVLKLQSKVKHLQNGDVLELLCTDPTVLHDIPVWCQIRGHVILNIDQLKDEIKIFIRINK